MTTARLTAVEESLAEPYLPFFIERSVERTAPATPGEAGGISRIEVAGDAARLERWLGAAALPVRAVAGKPGVRAITIAGRELRTP